MFIAEHYINCSVHLWRKTKWGKAGFSFFSEDKHKAPCVSAHLFCEILLEMEHGSLAYLEHLSDQEDSLFMLVLDYFCP